MNPKELYSIREWAPMANVLERIPARVQRGIGIFSVDLNITCIDAVEEFLALGSDAGVVFWYNRHTGDVQKLRAEITTRVTCVKIVNSVEYMVAAGNSSGQVTVFQIQKQLPPDLDLVAPCTRAKPIERYTIRDLHRSNVSCCEWSKNGMRLYSGDRQGVVVLTEFDYQAHLSKSIEILAESYEIVQLNVHQTYLLVSTLYRSIICQRNMHSGQWQITQVGKKDRKQLTDCGGIFISRNTRRPLVLCGRPGLRFWMADTEGNVEKTLLFKDAVTRSPSWEIPILNPKAMANNRCSVQEISQTQHRNFCGLQSYNQVDALVVTHDETTLYILNLERLCVEAVSSGFRKILDFCVCGKEIFILEGERSLLRLAPLPEKPNKTAKVIFNPSMPPPVPFLGTTTSSLFESPAEYEPEEKTIVSAEECFELPPMEQLNLDVPIELAVESPRAEQNRRLEIFNQISEMDFDQSILHHSGIAAGGNGRKKRKSRDHQGEMPIAQGIVEIGHAAVDDVELATHVSMAKEEIQGENCKQPIGKPFEYTTKAMLMDASYCLETSSSTDAKSLKESFAHYMPHVPSPTTLKKAIAEKSKALAEELDIPLVCLAPITSEEHAQAIKNTHPPPILDIAAAYSQVTKVEDAQVQTTPQKKSYFMEETCDYSAGQPVDDICQALRAANLVDDLDELDVLKPVNKTIASNNAPTSTVHSSQSFNALQFVPSQPAAEPHEIGSFLLDFRRAVDPMRRPSSTPPPSADSTASSEWEFLDN